MVKIMLEQNNNYGEMNQGIDRITEILRRQSTPAQGSPLQSQASQLPINILEAINYSGRNYASRMSNSNFAQDVQNYETNQQNRELDQQKGILEAYDMKLKMGDAQAKALDSKLQLFTGDDPEGRAMFLQALQDDPEPIDPSNSYQIMTKLAGIKKKLGYESPDLMMAKQKDLLDIDLKRAQINSLNSLAAQRSAGGSGAGGGQKPPSGYRFSADGQSLEAIPGGPGERISAELSARLGLGKKFLDESSILKEQLAKGKATGPVDYTKGALGYGVPGKIQRRVADGADALQRMLTGAGMPESEAADYSNRFRITYRDNNETAVDKITNLEENLTGAMEMSMRGRGTPLFQDAPDDADVDPRIQQALDEGYTMDEIMSHLEGGQ
jgi:hypothetical protein